MKNICIVSFCNLYYLPYAKTYIDKVKTAGNKCTLLFWDRDAINGGNDVYEGCCKIVFQTTMIKQPSKLKLIVDYLKATYFIRRKLEEEKYDGVIFLQSHCAVACYNTLMKYYKNKFILDIRDYSLEFLKPFYILEKKLLECSYANVISSPAYQSFLPESAYYIAHNYTPFDRGFLDTVCNKHRQSNDPIRISYVGTVRFYEMDKKLITLLGNDNRYRLNYYGRGSEVLKEFCEKKNIQNVDFYGAFSPKDVTRFYESTDLINNLYGNHTKELDYALSNKIYHSGQLHKPILVCPDTYMETISIKYNIGFVFDVNDPSMGDKLYKWYNCLDWEVIKTGSNRFIEDVIKDNEAFNNICNEFLK